jgi:Domain of unknown function (DUF3291)
VQPAGYHLAELNIGRLLAPTDDPRVAEFMDALSRVNALAERMPGYVWRMTGETGFSATDLAPSDDPRLIPNISVWENVQSLENFVWNTVHRAFYERRAEWFEVLGKMHFVMWWVPVGHKPTLDEALARLTHKQKNGDTDHAFGWSYLTDAQAWKTHGCAQVAAE